MSQPRIEMNATILPNGKVLAVGGSINDEDAATASLNADLYDPATNTFSSAGANAYPRLYHSESLLLPDATVVLVGGNPTRGTYEQHIEIYSPAYLFNANGTPALAADDHRRDARARSATARRSRSQTPNAASIASVVLVRPGAPTHAFDMEQRLVGLSFTAGSRRAERDGAAERQHRAARLLHAVRAERPRACRRSRGSCSSRRRQNQRPTATINSPPANVTIDSRRIRVVLRERQRSGWHDQRLMRGRSLAGTPLRARWRLPARSCTRRPAPTSPHSRSPTTED